MSLSRRSFISGVVASTLLSKFSFASTAVTKSPSKYKALVVLFLDGGNDGFNTLIPMDDEHYNEYLSIRQDLAIQKHELLESSLSALDRHGNAVNFGFHPALTGLSSLEQRGYVHAILNCGILKCPLNKYDKNQEPDMLFSHNSQSQEWFRGDAINKSLISGWGERLMECLSLPVLDTSPLYSFSGETMLFRGELESNSLTPNGARSLALTPSLLKRYKRTIESKRDETFKEYFRNVMNDGVYKSKALNDIIDIDSNSILSKNEDNDLSLQFDAVTKFINARNTLSQNKQIFFVKLGGFDTHANQLKNHTDLLNDFSEAIHDFYSVLDDHGMSDSVVTMTASDFGRRIVPNRSGSDHGWGNNHFIISGAPFSSSVSGSWPSLIPNGEDDIASGRLIPTTSLEQIGSSISSWMGVPDGQLQAIFPNLNNFYPQKLDIFA